MEGRSTVYNRITSPEKIAQINPKNKELSKDFLDYLSSIDRSPQTLSQYSHDLNVFFVWVLENLDNKDFIKITKREFAPKYWVWFSEILYPHQNKIYNYV